MKHFSVAILSTAALVFAGFSAQAHAQEASAQKQPAQQSQPQQQELPPPEPASPEDLAKCDKVASGIMQSMKAKDFEAATESFDPKLKAQLTPEKLKTSWDTLVSQYGEPQSIGHAEEGRKVQDFTIVILPMEFTKAKVGAQVVCDTDGKASLLRIGLLEDRSGNSDAQSPKS